MYQAAIEEKTPARVKIRVYLRVSELSVNKVTYRISDQS